MSQRKLAIFDIDGTIAVHGVVPESVVEGMRHIQSLGYLTTVSTGRPYRRMRQALAEHFDDIISPEALIIVEHGTKITHRDGRVVQADYFSSTEVDHFVDFIRANESMVRFCTYALPEPDALMQLWVRDPSQVEDVRAIRGSYSEIFHCGYDELKERIGGCRVSNFFAKLEDFVLVENLRLKLTRSQMDLIFQDGMMVFIGSLSDKSKAIAYLETFHEVAVKDMLVAGNAINDVDMLNMEAGKRVLVGTDEQAASLIGHLRDPQELVRIDSPEALGTYLQKLG